MPIRPLEPTLRDAYARCERIARERVENFPVLSEHLAPELIPHFAAVYAFCRIADDAGDESGSPEAATARLDALERELRAAFAGSPPTPEMTALAATAAEKRLPIEPFLALLSAFRQDQTKTRYADWDDLLDYCTRSANPVGELVLRLLDEVPSRDDGRKLAKSNAICTGLQLANFWQDVARDWAKGRIYAPLADLERHGVAEDQIARGVCDDRFRTLLASLCDRTDALFAEGASLADLVAKRHRIPVLAFALAGQGLLKRIREARYDVFSKRPEISSGQAKAILARAVAARWIPALRPKVAP
ncbi:MAG TPA: squalene synthase HpnC [Planctomycetota bacterium]|nr:squalene synthase HpnC [Planctomycetota bacterium]